MNRLALKIAAVALVQLALVGVAVAPRISARLTGEEYRLRVEPVDPLDPFRGAYVDLAYPDIPLDGPALAHDDGQRGTVYVTLVRDGDVWRAGQTTRERPSGTPYLACDDSDWRLRCGIESWWLPQDKAAAVQDAVAAGTAVAVIRVDGRGNAALMRVEVP
jgi:uncharacterized membrane-anchored protein